MSVISVKNLTFGYNSAENVFENVSFQIDTSWRLGFIGRNGKGKTTFLKLLMGEYDYTGQIRADVQFEYFPYAVEDKRRQTRKVLKDIAGQTEDWILERELNLMGMDGSCLPKPPALLVLFQRLLDRKSACYHKTGLNPPLQQASQRDKLSPPASGCLFFQYS